MQEVSTSSIPTNRKLMFMASLFFFSISVFITVVGTWALSSSHENYDTWISERASVIILDTGSTIFYGIPLFLFSFMIFGCYSTYMAATGKRSPWFDKKYVKPLSGLMIIGVVLMFVGKQVGTSYWEEKFQSEGYVRCHGSFALTSRWSVDVWALSPSICMDPDLKDALRHSGGSVYEINEYYVPTAE